jgi:hypothetical protein
LEQRGLVHEEVEQLAPVEGDHGDPLQVAGVQRVVAGDVDFAQLEGRSGADALER